jgi:hypothetical protein
MNISYFHQLSTCLLLRGTCHKNSISNCKDDECLRTPPFDHQWSTAVSLLCNPPCHIQDSKQKDPKSWSSRNLKNQEPRKQLAGPKSQPSNHPTPNDLICLPSIQPVTEACKAPSSDDDNHREFESRSILGYAQSEPWTAHIGKPFRRDND